jgi:hypothetical protein
VTANPEPRPTPPNPPAQGPGPATRFACQVRPSDVAEVQRTRLGAVQLGVREGSAQARIALSPAAARAMAAALLNAADEIEGVVPLVFYPRTPGEEIRGV